MGRNTGFERQRLVIVVLDHIDDMIPYNIWGGGDVGDGDTLDTLAELHFSLFIPTYHRRLPITLSMVMREGPVIKCMENLAYSCLLVAVQLS